MNDEQKEMVRQAIDNSKIDEKIATIDQLSEAWGLRRAVPAMGQLSQFLLDNLHPITEVMMVTLGEKSQDALSLYFSYMMHGLEEKPNE